MTMDNETTKELAAGNTPPSTTPREAAYNALVDCLEDLVKVYRSLLEVVRKEKEILVSTKLDDLNDNNRAKESLLHKSKNLEQLRIRFVQELADQVGLVELSPRLKDLAIYLDDTRAERLRNIHSVLELLLKRVQELNKQNEVLVDSALKNITGAMNSLKDNLQPKPVYQRHGEMQAQVTPGGHLVSKQV